MISSRKLNAKSRKRQSEVVLMTGQRGRPRILRTSNAPNALESTTSIATASSCSTVTGGSLSQDLGAGNHDSMPEQISNKFEQPPKFTEWEDYTAIVESYTAGYKQSFELKCCVRCDMQPGVFRCVHCQYDVCSDCKKITHGNFAAHKFLQWNAQSLMFEDIQEEEPVSLFCCSESSLSSEFTTSSEIQIIDINGIVCARIYTCQSCDKVDAMLAKGYFPGSESRVGELLTFFSISFLSTLDSLCFDGQLPLSRAITCLFKGSVVGQGRWNPGLADRVYQRLQRNGVLLRFRELQRCSASWPASCLLCPDQNSSRKSVVCADALFGWRRLQSMGSKQRLVPDSERSLPSPLIHVEPATVPPPTTQVSAEGCTNWKAGTEKPVIRASKHDVNGFFGLFCRHNRLLTGCNIITAGEGLCYPEQTLRHYLMTQPVSKDLIFIYDVGCRISNRVKSMVSASGVQLNSVTCAVNAFHVLGHERQCQLKYSVRVTPGAGLCDGENTERAWSALRPFGKSLKYMRSDRRSACMSYILHCFNANQLLYASNWFSARLKLITRTAASCSAEMEQLLLQAGDLMRNNKLTIPAGISEVAILNLAQQWHAEAINPNSDSPLSREPYAKLKALALERFYWIRQSGCSDGQKENRACLRKVAALNADIRMAARSLPPGLRVPTMIQLRDFQSDFYFGLSIDVSERFKRRVDLYHKLNRLAEEKSLLCKSGVTFKLNLNSTVKTLHHQPGLPAQFRCLFQTILKQLQALRFDHIDASIEAAAADAQHPNDAGTNVNQPDDVEARVIQTLNQVVSSLSQMKNGLIVFNSETRLLETVIHRIIIFRM
ncbi:hypothetical protein BOX15_Mlig022522g1 [Macrostomum lignano]|uniref:B box-type domain-containing protein n=1 Tax=Macrostomum lignano TaxID=282301 RepID=A0A267FMG2_9PLAT|nr:hypothetical protein BOX15_Mlig022522g1 [Macrostomum lignano]